ncbi:AAA family ATPase [Paractinoplanes globisporus]|uniref:AAA family ATPase n=1 Tax=Paractinoplanes globisporus TaxID=113565 RepID=A0ABW6WKX0_9ACTN|nr:AAA family ATPase [Actinoplanes globisporus]
MASGRSVVINGDLGSGKTTVSVLLARRLGVRRISIGDLYREMAAQRGLSALQLNLHAELDGKIDAYIDQIQCEIAASGERLVVDSRLAWHFFTDARKVHLITEPTVAAWRVLGRPTEVENYATLEEARTQLAYRAESERIRFLTTYGADKTRLRNYDIICDSTRATPEEIVEAILVSLDDDNLACYLDPLRIHPGGDDAGPLEVGYAAPDFTAIRGGARLAAAVRSGQTLVRAELTKAELAEAELAEAEAKARASAT